jgi:hypothetical protein
MGGEPAQPARALVEKMCTQGRRGMPSIARIAMVKGKYIYLHTRRWDDDRSEKGFGRSKFFEAWRTMAVDI